MDIYIYISIYIYIYIYIYIVSMIVYIYDVRLASVRYEHYVCRGSLLITYICKYVYTYIHKTIKTQCLCVNE